MNLPVPVAGQEFGPQWAIDINACMAVIDQHNHAPGSGVQITPAGLNINGDLSFISNNATALRSTRWQVQPSLLGLATDIGCAYVSGVDLYFNDISGNQIRITQSGGVAGSPGSISNLSSPASAAYVSGSQTFVWQSAANTPANLDAGSIILRNITANSKGITLNPPNALANNYSLTLPAALPGSQLIMSLDSSGNIAAAYGVDGSTIVISSNTIQVPASGITATQIAANTITAAKIANGTITTTQIAAGTILTGNIAAATILGSNLANGTITATQIASGTVTTTQIAAGTILTGNIAAATILRSNVVTLGYALSSSCSTFTTTSGTYTPVTNLSVTITTSGGPVLLQLISDESTNLSLLGIASSSGSSALQIGIFNGSTLLSNQVLNIANTSNLEIIPVSCINHLAIQGAGTYTFSVKIAVTGSSGTGVCEYAKLVAKELF